MFRGEKNTNWEGGYRVPAMIRWPGVIKPGTVVNDICCARGHAADAGRGRGRASVKEDLLKGRTHRRRVYKVHLDGYDLGPALGRGRLAAQGVHLLDRRRQRRGAALRQLEGHVPGAARPRASRSGRSPSSPLRAAEAVRTCAATRSSAPTRSAMGYERWHIEHVLRSSRRPAPTWANGCRASASSRRARSRAASTSTA